jgi:aspartyl/asparaginyl beta-hydroxylase (cupin superfamily)
MIPPYEINSTEPLDIWYNYKGGKPGNQLPAFFDELNWKWITEGESRFAILKNEIEALIKKRNHTLDPYFNTSLIESGSWDTLEFLFWNTENKNNCDACPEINRWLSSIPGLTSAGISRLSPGAEIKPHPGDTNGIARCHLGLIIPHGLPDCGIMVNGEARAWEEGKFTVFCDAYEHSAWNRTNAFRYILIVDVVLPRFLSKKKQIVSNVKSSLKLQGLIEKKSWVGKLPGPILGIIRYYYKLTASK